MENATESCSGSSCTTEPHCECPACKYGEFCQYSKLSLRVLQLSYAPPSWNNLIPLLCSLVDVDSCECNNFCDAETETCDDSTGSVVCEPIVRESIGSNFTLMFMENTNAENPLGLPMQVSFTRTKFSMFHLRLS